MKFLGLSKTIPFLPSAEQTLHPELLPAKEFFLFFFCANSDQDLIKKFGFQNISDANTTRILKKTVL
jgi:ethanolamine utilization microcompartment shell protein EutS